jgi:hypothetical protein
MAQALGQAVPALTEDVYNQEEVLLGRSHRAGNPRAHYRLRNTKASRERFRTAENFRGALEGARLNSRGHYAGTLVRNPSDAYRDSHDSRIPFSTV